MQESLEFHCESKFIGGKEINMTTDDSDEDTPLDTLKRKSNLYVKKKDRRLVRRLFGDNEFVDKKSCQVKAEAQ